MPITLDLTVNLPMITALLCTAASVVYSAGGIKQQIKNIVNELKRLEDAFNDHETKIDDVRDRISSIEGRCAAQHIKDDLK